MPKHVLVTALETQLVACISLTLTCY